MCTSERKGMGGLHSAHYKVDVPDGQQLFNLHK